MAMETDRDAKRAQLTALFERIYDELHEWRDKHPEASLDGIAEQVGRRRRQLMGELVAQLACQQGDGTVVEGVHCPRCGQRMIYKGRLPVRQEHLEGEIALRRAYYHCPACKTGIFPP
jgi:DNA-directed RNA polymerase subunit RPC12/RpoP